MITGKYKGTIQSSRSSLSRTGHVDGDKVKVSLDGWKSGVTCSTVRDTAVQVEFDGGSSGGTYCSLRAYRFDDAIVVDPGAAFIQAIPHYRWQEWMANPATRKRLLQVLGGSHG